MEWSIKRQLIYFGGIAAVIGLFFVIFIAPRFKTVPTCFDGKQNAAETGIDCGGTCEAACFFEANNLIIDWARAFPVSNGVYNVLAYVENQNGNLGVRNISYEIKLYDADDVFIARRTGHTFVGPNSKVPIFEAGINAGNRTPARTSFMFLEDPKWVKADSHTDKLPIYIKDQLLSNTGSSPRLNATIVNDSIYDANNLDIIAILYDKNSNAIATSKTYLDAVPKASSQKIFFTWPSPLSSNVEKIEIIPRINIFSISF